MSDIEALYREFIIARSRCTKHVGPLPSATGSATLHNPLCGDTITMHVELDASGAVVALHYEVRGCAIVKAVASVLADRVTGQPLERVRSWVRQSHAAVQGDERLGFPELEGMAKLPARQRCATLPWDSLDAALERSTRGGDAP